MPRRGVYLFWRAPAGRELRAGEWRVTQLHGVSWGAAICCPRCELIIQVEPAAIDAEGMVPAPTLCPAPSCGWLQSVQLVDWQEARAA